MLSLPPQIADLLEGGTRFKETTLQGYRSAWRDLLSWIRDNHEGRGFPDESNCEEEGPLPSPPLVADFLRDRMDLAWSTLTTRRQAIRYVYKECGEQDPFDHPDVEEVWNRIVGEKRRESEQRGKRLGRRKISPTDIIENGPNLLSAHLPSGMAQNQGDIQYIPEEAAESEGLTPAVRTLIPEHTFDLSVLRDRAILLLIATTTQPRKSLVGIDLEDIQPQAEEGGPTRIVMYDPDGDPTCVVRLESSSEVRYCPNRAVAAWILAADLESGPLFRPFNPRGGIRGGRIRPQTLNLVTKRWAEKAGFDPGDWSVTKLREHE